MDLEGTCWEPGEHPALAADQRNECEVLEIGAVRPADGAEFRTFVRPRRHPRLSAFCTKLTGIRQEDVDQAPSFPDALAAFLAFAGGDEDLVLASWGAWDDRQLKRDAERWGLAPPRWRGLNVKRAFARWAKRAHAPRGGWCGLSQAIERLGGTFEGTPHRALDDARMVAWVYARLETAPGR